MVPVAQRHLKSSRLFGGRVQSIPLLIVKQAFFQPLAAVLLLFVLFEAVSASATTPPVITRQPYRILYAPNHSVLGEWPPVNISPPRTDASSIVNIGCAIDLRIDVTGDELSYQWKKGNANIPGANGSQLFINVSSLQDAGIYRCEVVNPYGVVVSSPVRMAVLDISSSDHLLAASASAQVTFGLSVRFPTATGNFKYQWYRMTGGTPNLATDEILVNNTVYSGATKASLRVKAPNAAPAGSYYCAVYAYNTYMLTGLRNLAVVPAPASRFVQLGAPYQLEVVPAGPAALLAGLSYQWQKDGAELPDEDGLVYADASADAGDAGLYALTATHGTLGSVTTPSATVVVANPPVTFVTATAGVTAALTAPPAISSAQTFQWFRNGNPLVDNGKFSGSGKQKLAIKNVQPADAGDYECRGSLFGDTVVIARPVLIVLPAPQSRVVVQGAPLELQAQPAYGGSGEVNPALFSYQWIKGKGTSAVVLPDADGQSLGIASASPEDFGLYCCLVSYNGGPELATPFASVAVVDLAERTFNVNAGKSVRISPVVYALSGVQYAWSREGSPLSNGTKYSGVTTNRLTLNAASVADSGDYECTVSYPGGSSVAAPVGVVVFSAPEIADIEFPLGIVGGQFTYTIQASDDPLYAAQAFDAKPLPRGLVLNKATGVISGVPTASGEFDVLVSVKNAVGTTTQTATLTVTPLPSHLGGRFVAPLPRMPAGQFGELGGRFDMSIAATGALTGRLLVGATALPFKGSLAVSGTDPLTATATAEVMVPRTGGNLTLTFGLGADNYLSNGQITGAGNTVTFAGWRAVHSMASPPTALAGLFNIGLLPPPGQPSLPQGIGYGALAISATPASDVAAGNYNLAGRLADDQAFTCASFVGPNGELLAYQYLYGTLGGGSILGAELRINGAAAGRPVEGGVIWSRPASSTRRYKEGFGPLAWTAVGGAYVPGDRLLGATQGNLSFAEGGITEASRDPDATFSIGLGNVLPTRLTATPALTSFKAVSLAAGSFNGTFALADDNPTTPTVSLTEYKRTVAFKGMIVPVEGEQVGMGFFVMPQIPTTEPPTTTTNSPELSGNVLFEPVVD